MRLSISGSWLIKMWIEASSINCTSYAMITGFMLCINMNVIVIMLLIGLIGTLWLQWWLGRKDKKEAEKPPVATVVLEGEDNLSKLVEMMRVEREEKAQETRDRGLVEHAKRKLYSQPPMPIQSSLTHEEGPIPNATDYIPYGLSADEIKTLKDFYNQV